ncbi:hypothetical protein [Burkholderia cepacia]|uniref:hypothetical protein n=1 Tax=Burkholderia TaxID=32008 RepID=UPI00075E241C|nr:hypothetical protein [Burkholderia cepacia]KVW88253.1 hypothetical protein WL00_13560 [Burkholderia cepacia]KVX73771.1 hypothetical protein WL07_11430 [Burkholderia cepacia]
MDFLKPLVANLVFVALAFLFLRWLYGRIYDQLTESRRVAESTLTLAQYLQKYPRCRTPRGIQCAACHSMSIRNWGLKGSDDPRRIFICNHCNTRLYRTDNW